MRHGRAFARREPRDLVTGAAGDDRLVAVISDVTVAWRIIDLQHITAVDALLRSTHALQTDCSHRVLAC